MVELNHSRIKVAYDPEALCLKVICGGETFSWCEKPSILLRGTEKNVPLDAGSCSYSEYTSGTMHGVRARYENVADGISVVTEVAIRETDGALIFSSRVENESQGQVGRVYFPAAFDFGAEENCGYTVMPVMQGLMIPAKWQGEFKNFCGGVIFERCAYMAFFGQVKRGAGYTAVFDTPYDAIYHCDHTPGGDTIIHPSFQPSLGRMAYTRRMIYYFDSPCDYVKIAKNYRKYVAEKGELITLKEKIDRNPNIAKLIGTPVFHTGIATHIDKDSYYYDKEHPEKNDSCTPFEYYEPRLRELKSHGIDRLYIHLDGWGVMGYDNCHPDAFPVNEKAGGAKAMKSLADTCRELGYVFGIHDQYRDYYYSAKTYNDDQAIVNEDGSHPFCSVWAGGKHSWLCQALAPDYVRRNYDEFERLGIKIEGSYLDVFSVVNLDECFSPDHPMTRRQSAEYRRQCFDLLNSRGIITSSEETIDCIVPSIALCHHSPYWSEPLGSSKGQTMGIAIPLFNLVYHDCIVIPWSGGYKNKGGWGIPGTDFAYLHGILNAGTLYRGTNYNPEIEGIIKETLDLHALVAECEMVSHEFLGSYRKQRAVYSNGTSVEVDFDENTYKIEK